MSMQSDLRECLLAIVPLVYYAMIPDGVIPTSESSARIGWRAAVIVADIAIPETTICGASDLDGHRMQVDLYTATFTESVALRAPVFAAIEAAFPLATRITDMMDFDADLKLHRRIIEYSIPAE